MKIIKSLLNETLPDFILHRLKKKYYARMLNSTSLKVPYYSAIKSLIDSGDTVIDVGANIGSFTVALSKLVGDTGCVYSIEPISDTFDLLSNNVKCLSLNNIKLFNCALSSKEGSAVMEVPKWNLGGYNFYRASIINEESVNCKLKRYSVDLQKLDNIIVNPCSPITFVKIDVEGHFLPVIKGASNIIKLFHPSLLIEVSGNPDNDDSSAFILFKLLHKEGYEPYQYKDGKFVKRLFGDYSNDYFFLRKNTVEKKE